MGIFFPKSEREEKGTWGYWLCVCVGGGFLYFGRNEVAREGGINGLYKGIVGNEKETKLV